MNKGEEKKSFSVKWDERPFVQSIIVMIIIIATFRSLFSIFGKHLTLRTNAYIKIIRRSVFPAHASLCSFFCITNVDTENICYEQNQSAKGRFSALAIYIILFNSHSIGWRAGRYGIRIISIHFTFQRRCWTFSSRRLFHCIIHHFIEYYENVNF